MRLSVAAALALLALATPALAERLTPERLFAAPDISGPTARGVAFSPDGRLVTFLRAKSTDPTALDLWAVDAAGGEPRLLVDSAGLESGAQLSEAELARRERMRVAGDHGILEYSWDSQARQLLVPVSGDLWLAQVADGSVRRLTQTPGDEVDAKISPRGGFVSFVRDGRLYAIDLANGRERALSPEPAAGVTWGSAEFIAQEELDRFTGQWWSPDDRRIAYTRVDESGVDLVPRYEIGPEGVHPVDQRYPRAGRPNAAVRLYIQRLDGGRPVQVDVEATPSDGYIARVDWSRDGRTLYVQRLSRDQRRLDLIAVNPDTGQARILLVEQSPHWVNLSNDFRALEDGSFLWTSERSGYRHLYLYRADGELIRQVTHGDWPVRSVAGVDEATGRVFFLASTGDPTEQHLYAVSYQGVSQSARGSAPERFAPVVPLTRGHGWWTATLPKSGAVTSFVATYSDPDTPPNTGLYSAADGRRLRWIEENRLAPGHPYFAYRDRHPGHVFGSIRGPSGDTLYTELITPPGFNPRQRYPAILQVYGGPHSQTVQRSWNRTVTNLRLYAEAGYVVVLLDNRGSPNRGTAFEAAIDRRMGGPEVEDQLAGVAWLRRQPFVDPARVGVTGWSYGGYMTLRLLTAPNSPFAAGAAGAPVTDWRAYDTGYTERYMGTPQADAAAYEAASVYPRLGSLRARLLLLQGMADDNVPFDNSTRLSEALQAQGTVFEQMFYPGQRHGVRPPPKQLHLWRTFLDFFHRTLGGEGPPPTPAPTR